jgi:uncharacterized membrane protein
MAHIAGFSLGNGWLHWSIVLYLVGGAAWLRVGWMQIRMRDMAAAAARDGGLLPARYWRYLGAWVALGVVAFLSLVVVFYLMVAKPAWY